MEPVILAHDLGLKGSRGTVYTGVTVMAGPGDLLCLTGPEGSGRTSLLLTLAGRCDAGSGTLALFGSRVRPGLRGLRNRRDILRRTGLACVRGITDLDDTLTVGEHVGERAAVLSRLTERIARVDDEFVADVWGGAQTAWGPAPAARTPVWQLDAGARAVLEVQLARMGTPAILAVDDIDRLTDPAQRAGLLAALEQACLDGVCVLAVAQFPQDLAGLVPDHVIDTRTAPTEVA